MSTSIQPISSPLRHSCRMYVLSQSPDPNGSFVIFVIFTEHDFSQKNRFKDMIMSYHAFNMF